MDLHVVVLAAGKGTRMKSRLPKVLHPLAGRLLIDHVLGSVAPLGARTTTVVVGHEGDAVRAALADRGVTCVTQSPQLGTGHALIQTAPVLAGQSGLVLLVYGDAPLLQTATLARLVEAHRQARAAATVLTMSLDDPDGCSRIVRDEVGRIARIVDERDASAGERTIREVTSGIYCLALPRLFDTLGLLAADNAQGEYALTDLVRLFRQDGRAVEGLCVDDPRELRGVNTRADLADLARDLRARKNRALMLDGVTLEDPATTYVDIDVVIGADTRLGPGVVIEGASRLGRDCVVRSGARISNAVLGDRVTVLDRSVIADSTVGSGVQIGPFAHLRPGCVVGDEARIGNFVELKKTRLGQRSKASHLAYLGDATIGDDVNIGAGTITCNYDGAAKHPTIIEDGVFIGSDSQLVAPVRIGRGAYVAAGSTITHDVPPDALGVARSRQENKDGWAARRRARRGQEPH